MYDFAPVQSAVLGGFIALTDILLKPGRQGGGVEALLLFGVQALMVYGVYVFQTSSGFCGSAAKQRFDQDWSHILMKTGLGMVILWGTDQFLRPSTITNAWMQMLKFLIQGAILYHVYGYTASHSFMQSSY